MIEDEQDGRLPFVDTFTLRTTIYLKPIYRDQNLNWDSIHHIEHKRSVVRTLLRRAETVVSDPSDRGEEVTHVKKALSVNGYKKWYFEMPRKKKTADPSLNHTQGEKVYPVCILYVVGVLEHLQHVFWTHMVSSYHKPFNTLRSQLVKSKDKTLLEK